MGLEIALSLLLFILLFKLGEAFLGTDGLHVFYREVGFTENEIATVSKADYDGHNHCLLTLCRGIDAANRSIQDAIFRWYCHGCH